MIQGCGPATLYVSSVLLAVIIQFRMSSSGDYFLSLASFDAFCIGCSYRT